MFIRTFNGASSSREHIEFFSIVPKPALVKVKIQEYFQRVLDKFQDHLQSSSGEIGHEPNPAAQVVDTGEIKRVSSRHSLGISEDAIGCTLAKIRLEYELNVFKLLNGLNRS